MMYKLREAHQSAVNTILHYVQTAQRVVQGGDTTGSFRKELAQLIQQLALYSAGKEIISKLFSKYLENIF